MSKTSIHPCSPKNLKVHYSFSVDLGGVGVTCSPRDPVFAGSNPGEVDGFLQDVKNHEHKSSGRDFKLWVLSLKFQAH